MEGKDAEVPTMATRWQQRLLLFLSPRSFPLQTFLPSSSCLSLLRFHPLFTCHTLLPLLTAPPPLISLPAAGEGEASDVKPEGLCEV